MNILTCVTHEAYQTSMSHTRDKYFLLDLPNGLRWNTNRRPLPLNFQVVNIDEVHKLNIDIILSQSKTEQFHHLYPIALQLKKPLISLEHCTPYDGMNIHPFNQLKGDVNIFISEYSQSAWGWNNTNSIVIHHGIDIDLFNNYNLRRRNICLSAVHKWKERDIFCGFSIWKNLTESYNVPAFVIGDNDFSKSADSIEDLVNIYNTNRIYLNTSLFSPIPTALLEAMSCGCAIVSTSTCMIPEIIQHQKNGLLGTSIPELAYHCQLLLHNENLCNQLGEQSRNTIIEKFSINNFINNWRKVFESCI